MINSKDNLKTRFIGHLLLWRRAEHLIEMGERAHATDDREQLEQAGAALSGISEGGLAYAGAYYSALALNRSQVGRARAEVLLQGIADAVEGPLLYRAKALLALGYNHDLSDPHAAQSYYNEAERVNKGDSLVFFMVRFQRAVLASLAGAHRRALAEFERLRPLAESAARCHPFYGINYINSLAVAMSNVGSYSEAERLAQVANASPFARPEFQQTVIEIAARREAKARQSRLAEETRKAELRREIQSMVLVPQQPDPWTVSGLERVRDSAKAILVTGGNL